MANASVISTLGEVVDEVELDATSIVDFDEDYTEALVLMDGESVVDVVDKSVVFQPYSPTSKSQKSKRKSLKLPDSFRDLKSLTDIAIKAVAGSRQMGAIDRASRDLSENDLVEPPYNPDLMLQMIQSDEVLHRAIEIKSHDATMRRWTFEPDRDIEGNRESTPAYKQERDIARDFIEGANDQIGFFGALNKVWQDRETYGWGALEVIRSQDMKIKRVDYVSARKVKALKNNNGFVEYHEDFDRGKTFYVPFGQKVLSRNRVTNEIQPYHPRQDGELSKNTAEWNLIDYETGKPTQDFNRSANEIVWLKKRHPLSRYYGVTDSLPCLGSVLANIHIREYLLQFFENNAVPRFVVIIKGSKLTPALKKTIMDFFRNGIKGRAHSTLIIPLPVSQGQIEIEFKELDGSPKTGWFLDQLKDNQHSIRICHNVPAAVMGFAEAASLGSGKGLAQAEMYKDRVVDPNQREVRSIIVRLFQQGLGLLRVVGQFEKLDTRDQEGQMRVLTGYFDRAIMTINEVRTVGNLGPEIPGGDRPFRIIGNTVLFLDEIMSMTSGPVGFEATEKIRLESQLNLAKNRSESVTREPNGEVVPGNNLGKFPTTHGGDRRLVKPPENPPSPTMDSGIQNSKSAKN